MLIFLIILLCAFLFLLFKHTFKTVVLLILSFIALYITNPTEEKFKTYYSNQITQEEMDKSWLEKVALEGIAIQGKMTLKRKDLSIFSVYQIDQLDKKIGYLGFFNIFVPIYEEDDAVI